MLKRKFWSEAWSWNTTTTAGFWRYFTFDAALIPAFAEYANTFDQYKVNGLKYEFRPRYDSVEAAGAGTTGAPQAYAHTLIDPESTLIPSGVYGTTTLNQLMENTGIRTRTCNRPITVYYKPRMLMQAFNGGTAGVVTKPRYIRTSDTTVNHRGFHMYVHQNNLVAAPSANANIVFDVFVTVYLSLKNPR